MVNFPTDTRHYDAWVDEEKGCKVTENAYNYGVLSEVKSTVQSWAQISLKLATSVVGSATGLSDVKGPPQGDPVLSGWVHQPGLVDTEKGSVSAQLPDLLGTVVWNPCEVSSTQIWWVCKVFCQVEVSSEKYHDDPSQGKRQKTQVLSGPLDLEPWDTWDPPKSSLSQLVSQTAQEEAHTWFDTETHRDVKGQSIQWLSEDTLDAHPCDDPHDQHVVWGDKETPDHTCKVCWDPIDPVLVSVHCYYLTEQAAVRSTDWQKDHPPYYWLPWFSCQKDTVVDIQSSMVMASCARCYCHASPEGWTHLS